MLDRLAATCRPERSRRSRRSTPSGGACGGAARSSRATSRSSVARCSVGGRGRSSRSRTSCWPRRCGGPPGSARHRARSCRSSEGPLARATEELARPRCVWSGDARDGFNGGGNYVRWVLDEADRDAARGFFRPRCDRVRVMPFLDGVPVLDPRLRAARRHRRAATRRDRHAARAATGDGSSTAGCRAGGTRRRTTGRRCATSPAVSGSSCARRTATAARSASTASSRATASVRPRSTPGSRRALTPWPAWSCGCCRCCRSTCSPARPRPHGGRGGVAGAAARRAPRRHPGGGRRRALGGRGRRLPSDRALAPTRSRAAGALRRADRAPGGARPTPPPGSSPSCSRAPSSAPAAGSHRSTWR